MLPTWLITDDVKLEHRAGVMFARVFHRQVTFFTLSLLYPLEPRQRLRPEFSEWAVELHYLERRSFSINYLEFFYMGDYLLHLFIQSRACLPSCSVVSDSVTLRIVACQAPLSMGFFRQEYWSGLPCSPPGDLPNSEIEPTSPVSPALADGFFTTVPAIRNLPANAGDVGSIPGSGRFPGGGNGNPFQYSCLENPMNRAVCRLQSMG